MRRAKKRHAEEKRSLEKKKASPPSVVPKVEISAFASPSFVIDLTLLRSSFFLARGHL